MVRRDATRAAHMATEKKVPRINSEKALREVRSQRAHHESIQGTYKNERTGINPRIANITTRAYPRQVSQLHTVSQRTYRRYWSPFKRMNRVRD